MEEEIRKQYETETGQKWCIIPYAHGENAYASWEYQLWLENKVSQVEKPIINFLAGKWKKLFAAMLIIIYLASCVGAWYGTKWNFTHRWTYRHPNAGEIVMVYIPIINTFLAADYLEKQVDASDFFDIKSQKDL